MPIQFRCPICTKLLRVPEEAAGRQAKCPACGNVVMIPASFPRSEKSEPPSGTGWETPTGLGGGAKEGPAGAGPEGMGSGGVGAGGSTSVGGPPIPPQVGFGPMGSSGYPSGGALDWEHQYALSKVSGPATGLMVLSILGIVVNVLSLLLSLAGISLLAMVVGAEPRGAGNDQFLGILFHGVFNLIGGLLGLAVQVFILLAATKMKQLESYGWAMAAAILSVIPCTSPCCFLIGIPIGIWALVVLNDPRVKGAFR